VGPIACLGSAAFNGGRFLAAAVEGILNQSYDDFELIAIDDAEDQSAAGLLRTGQSDRRIRAVTQANAGTVASLNTALELAVGEYIAGMAADDVALPF
jgi:glycosyltransferase involved in cell wall biosynthesis